MESRDASFFEDIFPMRAVGSNSLSENNHTPPLESFDEIYTPPEEDNHLVNEPTRKSKRPRIAKSFGDDFIVYLVDHVPKTLSQAYASPDAEYWNDVVRSEMLSCQMGLGRSLIVQTCANQLDVSGSSRRN
jgi:hypothetical protein